jgi:putative peptidoglycan lipid II flippase
VNIAAPAVGGLDAPAAKPSSANASLFRSTASVSLSTVLAKIAGAGKTALITLFFRPGAGLDAYLLSFLFVSFFIDVFLGALNPVLVPMLVEADEKGGGEKRDKGWLALYGTALHRSLFGSIVLAGALVTGSAAVHSLGWLTEPASPGLFNQMLWTMLPMLPLTALTCIWRAVLNAELRVGAANFSYVFTPIIASLVLAGAHHRGVIVLAAGSSFGVLVEAVFLAGVLRNYRIALFPRRTTPPTGFHLPLRQFWAIVAGNLVSKGAIAVDQAAAAIAGVGGLSIFNLGTRLAMVVLAVGPGALGTAILPRFSRLVAGGSVAGARRALVRTLGFSFLCMAVISCVLIWYSEPIARRAFAHGVLTSLDLARVSQAQRWSLMQAPFSVGLAILFPFVASLKANHFMLPVLTAALLAHAGLDFLVAKRFGVSGILCVSAGVEAIVLVATMMIVFRRLGSLNLNQRAAQ